jgi:radical SAM superfamily enzyme YgiQ (UPF0313 family)
MRFSDTAEYLKESGLKSAVFGIETINHESGKAIGKGVDPMLQFDFIKQLKNTHFKDILTFSGFIIGLPKDSNDDMARMEEFLFSDKNMLDDFIVEPLYITPHELKNETKTSYSEFDLEYEKYGYECYEQFENSSYTETRWKNNITNMSFDECFAFSKKINERVKKTHKFGGFGYAWYKSIGVTSDDLVNLSKLEILYKYRIRNLWENKRTKYRTQLLKFIKEGTYV